MLLCQESGSTGLKKPVSCILTNANFTLTVVRLLRY